MRSKSRELRDQLVEAARYLRSHPTNAELVLWNFLRKKQISGFKFRKQHIIQTFIVDFYCPAAKLVIEVDGEIHLKQKETDKERTKLLELLGYKVLRFQNNDINRAIPEVIKQIEKSLRG